MLGLELDSIEALELMVRFLSGPSASRDRLARAGNALSATGDPLVLTAKLDMCGVPASPDSNVLSLLPRGRHDADPSLPLFGREVGVCSRSDSEFSAS